MNKPQREAHGGAEHGGDQWRGERIRAQVNGARRARADGARLDPVARGHARSRMYVLKSERYAAVEYSFTRASGLFPRS